MLLANQIVYLTKILHEILQRQTKISFRMKHS